MASADFLTCEMLFECLADAKDTSMLESRHAAVMLSERLFHSIPQTGDGCPCCDNTPLFRLCTRATANSINVALQDTGRSLLLQRKPVEVVCALCHILTQCIRHAYQQNSKEFLQGERDQVTDEITAAGLPSALIKFTEAAWQAVQQLETNDQPQPQQQQQQQQQQLVKNKHKNEFQHPVQQQHVDQSARCLNAAFLLDKLLAVWDELPSCLAIIPAHREVLPLLMKVVTAAPTLLQQAARSTGCSCSNSSGNFPCLPQFEKRVRSIAAMAAQVAFDAVNYYSLSPLQSEDPELQQIIQADKLPELLLLLLAHQAANLHKMCSGMSQVVQANRAAAARSHRTDELQQQRDQPSSSCLAPPHHLTLLRLIGYSCNEEEGPVFRLDIQHVFGVTLATLHDIVLARHTAVQLNSNSTDSSHQDTGQQQQQQQLGAKHSVLPSHLLVPAVKVLIEMLLLLPPSSNPCAHHLTVNLIELPLTTTVTPPSTPPAAAAAAAAAPWLQLPAAVAAGHSHAVEAKHIAAVHIAAVHIAAVLKSQSAPDLLISLAAIEAVIRAQACPLAPASWEHQAQQQQQQQRLPDVHSVSDCGSNSRSLDDEQDIRHHPPAQAPLLLLPFVSKVVDSLESAAEYLLQQQGHGLTMPPTESPGSVSRKLSARLCTLLATALKIGKCAVAAAAPDQQERVSRQVLKNAATVNKFASCWFSAVQDSTSRRPGACTVVQNRVMSVALMFRALHAGSFAMASWAARYDLQLAAATAAAATEQASLSATAGRQLCAGEITGVTHFEVLEGLDQALAKAGSVLDNLAGAGHTAPTTTTQQPALSQQHGHISSSVLCREPLQHLGHQSQQIRLRVLPPQLLFEFTLPRLPEDVVCVGYTDEEVVAMIAPRSIDEVCDMLQKDIDEGHPSEGMPASPGHLSTLACDLAAAVLPWFPLTVCCNNPDCTNLTKLSEWQLVCGKACVCAGCEVARYCSSACQQQHWNLHKHVCSGLSAQK